MDTSESPTTQHHLTLIESDRVEAVAFALKEDIRTGDLTAQLVPNDQHADATLITREPMTLAGQQWVEEVFKQLQNDLDEPKVSITWQAEDGAQLKANDCIATFSGPARTLLTGERPALNFLQTLSATATVCTEYAAMVTGTEVKLLDTRKTIPGLRTAQKYAVTCGGCYNHRMGLYDAFLIKENHIMAAGSLSEAVRQARQLSPKSTVEVEVESLEQLQEALDAASDVIMLDNFSMDQTRQAVAITAKRAKLEISGNVNKQSLRGYAETGVDYISIGGLTKHVDAIDLSMRFT